MISLTGVVNPESLRVGDEMTSIMRHLKNEYNLLIGENTAEKAVPDRSAMPVGKPNFGNPWSRFTEWDA